MKQIKDELELFTRLINMICGQFGKNCEVCLHDYSEGYERSLLEIKNGHVTNREIGDCGSSLGLEVLRGEDNDGDRYNYVTHTKDGKILRSSTMFIRDNDGKALGALCINYDMTDSVKFENYLQQLNNYKLDTSEPVSEIFANDVSHLMTEVINEASNYVGIPGPHMSKHEKMMFINYLDKKGIFLITKSSDRICELLNISKNTFYLYLDAVRGDEKKR